MSLDFNLKNKYMLLHRPTGRIFSTKKEARSIMGIGDTTYRAKCRDGEIFYIDTTDKSKINNNLIPNQPVHEELHTVE